MNHFAARCWGGVLMGVFFQQSGWLCHEICHHQCFKNRIHGKFLGYFWGNCAQGFSVAWWTNKHCTHHAVPNVHGDEASVEEAREASSAHVLPFVICGSLILVATKS